MNSVSVTKITLLCHVGIVLSCIYRFKMKETNYTLITATNMCVCQKTANFNCEMHVKIVTMYVHIGEIMSSPNLIQLYPWIEICLFVDKSSDKQLLDLLANFRSQN